MAKFDEAMNRLFRNVFVCKKCKSKVRAHSLKVSHGLVKCRSCGSRLLRPKRKK